MRVKCEMTQKRQIAVAGIVGSIIVRFYPTSNRLDTLLHNLRRVAGVAVFSALGNILYACAALTFTVVHLRPKGIAPRRNQKSSRLW